MYMYVHVLYCIVNSLTTNNSRIYRTAYSVIGFFCATSHGEPTNVSAEPRNEPRTYLAETT
jgi:hypothetical protein